MYMYTYVISFKFHDKHIIKSIFIADSIYQRGNRILRNNLPGVKERCEARFPVSDPWVTLASASLTFSGSGQGISRCPAQHQGAGSPLAVWALRRPRRGDSRALFRWLLFPQQRAAALLTKNILPVRRGMIPCEALSTEAAPSKLCTWASVGEMFLKSCFALFQMNLTFNSVTSVNLSTT